MKYEVDIEVKNKQKLKFDEQDFLKNNSEGFFYIKDNIYYLIYKDYSEGIKGARTTLKIDPVEKRILLLRSEPAEMKQIFSIGEKTKGFYKVEKKKLKLEVDTKNIQIELSDFQGKIEVEYSLYLMGEMIGDSSLEINYTKKGVEKNGSEYNGKC